MKSNTDQSRRIVHYAYGEPQRVLQVEDNVDMPPLTGDQVCVRVSRSPVHPGDLQLIESTYAQPATAIPAGRVPGLEAVGTVEDAAPGALQGTGLTLGSRVAFFAPGAWQSRTRVAASTLLPIPDDVPDAVAAQIVINTITARHLLRTGLRSLPNKPHHVVLTSAASAVAKLLTLFAMHEGLTPIRLVRSSRSAEQLASLLPGGDIINTGLHGWQESVRELSHNDIPIVFDGLGSALFEDMTDLLNVGGTFVSYGMLTGATADLTPVVMKALRLTGVTINTWRNDTTQQERSEDMAAAIRCARTNPQLFAGYREFALAELSTAIDAVSAAGKTGNVLLKFQE